MQRLGNRPQSFFAVRRLDQDHAAGIEAQGVEAVSGNMSAKPAVWAQPITRHMGRHDDDERVRRRQAAQERHDEAEGGSDGALRLRHDLVQGAAGEAALRQV